MDALKLAFDTLIVGALALPWLAIVLRIFTRGRPSGGLNLETAGALSSETRSS